MWGNKDKNNQQPAVQPTAESQAGTSASPEFEQAVRETESPVGFEPEPRQTAQEEAESSVTVALMGKEIALAIAKFPFARLAAVHPAWMPPSENLAMLGGHVEGAGNELLEKLLPAMFVKYASQFPATWAMLQAFAGVMMMQFFLVRKLQAEEFARRQAAEAPKTVTVPATAAAPAAHSGEASLAGDMPYAA